MRSDGTGLCLFIGTFESMQLDLTTDRALLRQICPQICVHKPVDVCLPQALSRLQHIQADRIEWNLCQLAWLDSHFQIAGQIASTFVPE